jgi:hypothetical protein
VGYNWVSTEDQVTNVQLDAVAWVGCTRVFSVSAAGAQRDRPKLGRALDYMRPGDTLVVWKLEWVARSFKQLIETVESLGGNGIGFRSVSESIDTTYHRRQAGVPHIRGAGRGRALHDPGAHPSVGLDTARARSRVGDRPRSLTDKDLEMAKTLLANPDITVD